MSYFKPYVDETGYHYPTYDEILDDMITKLQEIYGTGIYLGNDSPDYELLSVIAEKIYDTYQAIEMDYNSKSPVTAIGASLDYIVAVNGIVRKMATKSTVELTLTGEEGNSITIENGVVADINGILWDLPEIVIIGTEGTTTVVATCREYGQISADKETITTIMTPVSGWISVTNNDVAYVGEVAEKDSELRARQANSVSIRALSTVESLRASIAALDEVNRCIVFENDTNETDANGVPAHSVYCIVDNGDDDEIAKTIYLKKGPGVGTHGEISVEVVSESGRSNTIHFGRVQYVDVSIEINIVKRAGYVSTMKNEIKYAVADYLGDFEIGADLPTSIIWMVAQQINADARNPSFTVASVKAARLGEPLSTDDVIIALNEAARGRTDHITVNVS